MFRIFCCKSHNQLIKNDKNKKVILIQNVWKKYKINKKIRKQTSRAEEDTGYNLFLLDY